MTTHAKSSKTEIPGGRFDVSLQAKILQTALLIETGRTTGCLTRVTVKQNTAVDIIDHEAIDIPRTLWGFDIRYA
jgi:hypothetical protein